MAEEEQKWHEDEGPPLDSQVTKHVLRWAVCIIAIPLAPWALIFLYLLLRVVGTTNTTITTSGETRWPGDGLGGTTTCMPPAPPLTINTTDGITSPHKLFENERCVVWDLHLAAGEVGMIPLQLLPPPSERKEGDAASGGNHLLLQVGRAILQPIDIDGQPPPSTTSTTTPISLTDTTAHWNPFKDYHHHYHHHHYEGKDMLAVYVRNQHQHCHSRTIVVDIKTQPPPLGSLSSRWRGEEVLPGRRFEEEEWEGGEQDKALMEEEEMVLSGRSPYGPFSTQVGTNRLLDNQEVVLWEFVIAPGEDAPIHLHTSPYFFINLGESLTCGMSYKGEVSSNCHQQGDGLVTWIDVSSSSSSTGTRRKKRLRHVHGVRNVGTTWFRQFIVEFL